ncbi:MAG TPA: helix-turn-helix domain-containing protein [Candidatus Hydrogenedentes bacterium]|nr:helix-turn-helix domain-containing protein [Candidatus Hydrogenedentota bacterium]HOM48165.1 helix-turn-helix domain-containing protein [Candidatus Hydrogenedentota bacterium]HPK25831.1 helix-turn-helix domain-containing protein [Candidatus Hydrogenedentota bacterium]
MKLLTVNSLADKLEVSRRTIWRWRDSGALPAPVRIGGTVRWRNDVINAWMAANCPHCRKTGWRGEP